MRRALAALVFVFVLGLIFNAQGAFFEWGTHRDMLRQVSVYGILACGMTVVIITAGIDLSVGSILGFIAVLFSVLTLQKQISATAAIPICLAAGAFIGLASGGLITRFRMQPFIATLAMMVCARGLGKYLSGGQKISSAVARSDGTYEYLELPQIFRLIDQKILGDNIAVVTVIFILCIAITGLLLSKLRWGRYFYAIGGNEESSRLSGVPTVAVKVFAYALCGFFAALAGICQAAQEQQGDPEAGISYELTAIAIVVIGGTSLNGGRGGIRYTLIGAITIGYLEKILSINAVGEASRLMLTGAIIVAAVLLQRVKGRGYKT